MYCTTVGLIYTIFCYSGIVTVVGVICDHVLKLQKTPSTIAIVNVIMAAIFYNITIELQSSIPCKRQFVNDSIWSGVFEAGLILVMIKAIIDMLRNPR